MTPTIRVEAVHLFDTREDAAAFGHPEADGYVWYEIEYHEPGAVAHFPDGSTKQDLAFDYLLQPFAVGGSRKDSKGGIMWGWNGNKEAPTLEPSYLAKWQHGSNRTPMVAHLFLRAGKIDLCGDSTVILHSAPS